jgi:zinc transport system substrate-binding protein
LLSFENALKEKLAITNKNVPLVNCSVGFDPIAGLEEEDHGHEHGHTEAYDPHIWLAPAESKIIALNTLKALKAAFPEHDQAFDANYSTFIAKIDSISTLIDLQLENLGNRQILIFHPALAYYARQFNLQQVALEMDGKEPSPRHMKEIVDLAHRENIHVIFIQKEFDPAFAQQLAKEINGRVEIIDPLDYDFEKQLMDITAKIAAQ